MLSPIVEYILSLNRPSGGVNIYPHRIQFIINFTPNAQMIFAIAPPLGSYAAIKYASTISQQCVPGAVYMEITQAGAMYAVGVDEADWNREYLPYFVVFTEAHPINLRMVNMTALNQRMAGSQWNILIGTESDLEFIKQRLDEYSEHASGELGREANVLLSQIAEVKRA